MQFLIDALGLENVTSRDLMMWAAILILAAILFVIFKIAFSKPKPSVMQRVRCPCGWTGQVSRYAGRCPMCNESLGEQRAAEPRR